MKISWSSPEISVLLTLPRSVRQPPIVYERRSPEGEVGADRQPLVRCSRAT